MIKFVQQIVNICAIMLTWQVTSQNLYNSHAHDVKIWTRDSFHPIPPHQKNHDDLGGIFQKYVGTHGARIHPRA
eukprot:UN20887